MVLEVCVKDESGNILAFASGPASQPVQWKAPAGGPIIIDRGNNNGAYRLWVVTATPTCVLDLNYNKGAVNARPAAIGTSASPLG